MKILLLGATGRTGKLLVKEAVSRDYEVVALVRYPERLKAHAREVTIIQGNSADKADLERAIEGCDAVLNTLNISRKNDFPWAPLRTPRNYLEVVMSNLLSTMESANVPRIVLCSAWGVGDSRKEIPGWFRWFIDHSNIGAAYSQHEKQEEMLSATDLDWTIVRPVGLTNGKASNNVMISRKGVPRPSLTISRSDVARFMLNALETQEFKREYLTISHG